MKTQVDVAVDEREEVKELREELTVAQTKLRESDTNLTSINKTLDPPPSDSRTSSFQNEAQVLRAHQELPAARMRYLEDKAVVLELTPRFQRVRDQAVRDLTNSRSKARLPLLRRFTDALEEARDIGEAIRAFDEETTALGGRADAHPLTVLLDEPPYREGLASMVRRILREAESR